MEDKKIKNKRRLKGVVVSANMDKTAVVKIARKKMHSKYKKQYKVSKNYKIHDEKNLVKIGDTVIFEECRPLSKEKRWKLINISK